MGVEIVVNRNGTEIRVQLDESAADRLAGNLMADVNDNLSAGSGKRGLKESRKRKLASTYIVLARALYSEEK